MNGYFTSVQENQISPYLLLSTDQNQNYFEKTLPKNGNASPSKNEIKILVAEDNRINLLAITRYLYKKGYSITGVSDGKKAVEAIFAEQYDCIIMDIQMPHMDGVTATETIRSTDNGATPSGVPIIAMTAYALPGDRERFLESGMDDYIPKPLDFNDLEKIIMKYRRE